MPLVIAQLILAIVALIHVLKHPHYRFGNKPMWILIVLLFQTVGPIVYFIFGRDEEQ
ncbi:MAG: PLD nuclease N-terminal domain-containing protein [Propionibacteriaceae bacterium]|nr:PLD nuclease N-terminal domain-containing protein [Propionibacteriaceae bacterium]